VALAALALVIVTLTSAPADERGLKDFFGASQAGVSVLFPVIGILSVTSEWSQRTALTTFTLVPDRLRILAAKLGAGTVLALLGVAVGLLLATVGRTVAGVIGRGTGEWSLPPALIVSMAVAAVMGVAIGVAFGTVLMNAPVAIVAYFAVPTVFGILADLISSVRPAAAWIDPGRAMEPLYDTGVTAGDTARLATMAAIWLAVPLAAGAIRLLRTEIH
jgi:hypothetical protein